MPRFLALGIAIGYVYDRWGGTARYYSKIEPTRIKVPKQKGFQYPSEYQSPDTWSVVSAISFFLLVNSCGGPTFRLWDYRKIRRTRFLALGQFVEDIKAKSHYGTLVSSL